MAREVISSVLSLGYKLASMIGASSSSSSSIDPRNSVQEDLSHLTRTLQRIEAVLDDAEEREIRDHSVMLWLQELRDVAYQAEDVLDEYQYEVLRAQVEGRAAAAVATRKRKFVDDDDDDGDEVRETTSPSLSSNVPIPNGMGDRIREIRQRFDEIAREREALRLREEDGQRRARVSSPLPTDHVVDLTSIFGREDEKEEMIGSVLSEDNKSSTYSVIPIVGKGGLGKTTLARLVYNDPRVSQYFDYRVWIHVSHGFNVVQLTKKIIEAITGESCDFTELSLLQDILKDILIGKKLFLVLDDVWNDKHNHWESVRAPFTYAATARIIVTTRNDPVAKIMQTVPACYLGYLPEDQCWQLFRHQAFDDRGPVEHSVFVEIGEQIVKKCGGLPLAVKTLGGLLRYETDEESWREVLESDLWELDEDNEILATLRLSYNWMPTRLKPCFLYIGMYPKNYLHVREMLIRLWMAQGYIQPRGGRRTEDIAGECFDELVRRSILDSFDFGKGGIQYFRMHEMLHDLALSISGKGCHTIDNDELCEISDEVHHLYVEEYNEPVKLMLFDKPRTLRTLLLLASLNTEVTDFSMIPLYMRNLRTLVLRCHAADELPDSIGSLKHLRYLRLMGDNLKWLPNSICLLYNLQTLDLYTRSLAGLPRDIGNLVNLRYIFCWGEFEALPESICGLYNLQTLDLIGCKNLKALPDGIGNLRNLHELMLSDSKAVCMPPGFGKLSNLRNLCAILKVRRESVHGGGIVEVKDLVNLRGYLCISGLKNMVNLEDARNANLKSKSQLQALELKWTGDSMQYDSYTEAAQAYVNFILEPTEGLLADEVTEELVLESLQPHTNRIEMVIIDGYGGARFPSWFGSPSFSKLTTIILVQCSNKRCLYLPPLGLLPSLTTLFVAEMLGIQRMGQEFCGRPCGESAMPTTVTDVGFPSLAALDIINMYELEEWCGVMNGDFPRLQKATIKNCPKLRTIPTLPSLEHLCLRECEKLGFLPLHPDDGRPSFLQILCIEDCLQLKSLVGLHELKSLEKLEISNCPEFDQLPQEEPLPPKLQAVRISRCWKLTSLVGLQDLSSLQSLHLSECPQLRFQPNECLQSMPDKVEIVHCPKLVEWCQWHKFEYVQHLSGHSCADS